MPFSVIPLCLWFSLATMFVGYRMALWQFATDGNWGSNGWVFVPVIITCMAVIFTGLSLLIDSE